MRNSSKFLCFILMLALFCAFTSGGCGGSSGGGSYSGSEDVPAPAPSPSPTSPDNPAPAPAPTPTPAPNNTTGLNGTWQVSSSTLETEGYSFQYVEGSSQPFSLILTKNSGNNYYTIALSGSGVRPSHEDYYDSLVTASFTHPQIPYPVENVEVIAGIQTYEQTGTNTYTFTREHTVDEELGEYTLICRVQLVDSSTITCFMQGNNAIINTTFKRVN